MTIKHFQTKGGRYTTALTYHVGNRTLYDFDKTKIQLALSIADQKAINTLTEHLGVLSKGSLLAVDCDWEIDI